jgi:hypothetical protein
MSLLNEQFIKFIDTSTYQELLDRWRFSPIGDLIFQGDIGDYYIKIMNEKRAKTDHVAASKAVGWNK